MLVAPDGSGSERAMKNRWRDEEAEAFVARYAERCDRDLALRTYSSRLIGADRALVLHGGGNTSLEGSARDVFGQSIAALFVKASGQDLAGIEPEGHVAVELAPLRRLCELPELGDDLMECELRRHLFDPRASMPSIETPVHAWLPGRFVDHTHADAVLALCSQPRGEEQVRRALGEEVVILPYTRPGLQLARQVAEALEAHPDVSAMVWLRHGIATWGESARESYDRMIELVSAAERHLEGRVRVRVQVAAATGMDVARRRLARVSHLVRGMLSTPTGDADRPWRRVVLRPLVTREVLDQLDAEGGRELLVSAPLTADHLIRTGPLPAWVAAPDFGDDERLKAQLRESLQRHAQEYRAYLARHAARMPPGVEAFDPVPRVVLLPGLGALCAGRDAAAATIARDITAQTLAAKARIAAMGSRFEGLSEEHLFDMEYRLLQHAKLERSSDLPLTGHVVLVTGAAGAIGSGLCAGLAARGAHVAVTDLAGPGLDALVDLLEPEAPGRVIGVPLDVSDADSVEAGFEAVISAWGGVDQVVINAGLAHVASLGEMDPARFRLLERVNVDGTLLLLAEAGRHFGRQGTGGDVVLISSKNVFSPGARFGAYSATKAAAHQLARIASLELADGDVRVNMVSPDAVFSHGDRASGLWQAVGPDRMQARGLDAAGLEQYYRERNLLKARITAEHVAHAVLYFLTRQSPTTGATLPVDGGLPDATPR